MQEPGLTISNTCKLLSAHSTIINREQDADDDTIPFKEIIAEMAYGNA